VLVADVLAEIVLLDHPRRGTPGIASPAAIDGPAPGLEPVAVGEQVAVGPHPGIAVRPPRAAPVVLGVEDDERPVRELLEQLVRGADAGHPGADDEDVDVTGVLDLGGARFGCAFLPRWGSRVPSSSWLALRTHAVFAGNRNSVMRGVFGMLKKRL